MHADDQTFHRHAPVIEHLNTLQPSSNTPAQTSIHDRTLHHHWPVIEHLMIVHPSRNLRLADVAYQYPLYLAAIPGAFFKAVFRWKLLGAFQLLVVYDWRLVRLVRVVARVRGEERALGLSGWRAFWDARLERYPVYFVPQIPGLFLLCSGKHRSRSPFFQGVGEANFVVIRNAA